MTKDTEIKLLDGMISNFGRQSYLGPWLMEHRDQIVANITSDWTPNPLMPGEANRQAREIVENAKQEAKRIKDAALLDAHKIKEAASKEADEARKQVRLSIERIVNDLKSRGW